MNKEHLRRRWLGVLIAVFAVCLLISPGEAQAADNSDAVFVYLTDELGFTPAAACGIMGNIYYESNFTANITNYLGAFGLCQWLGPRRTRLNTFCASQGYSVTSMEGQLQYLAYELKNYYPAVNNYLKSVPNTAKGAYNAASYFCLHFEIPENASYNAQLRGYRAGSVYWKKFGADSIWLYGWNGSRGIYMKWAGGTGTYYQVWRSTSKSSGFRKIGNISSTYHSCGDPNVTVGKTYYYYIVCANKEGKELSRSNTISMTRESSMTDSVCVVTLDQESWTYTGERIKPGVTVVYDGTKLKRGTDYTVSYGKNVDAGNGTVTIKGKGTYGGSLTMTFTIEKAQVKITVKDLTVFLRKKKVTPQIEVSGLPSASYTLSSKDKTVATVSGKTLVLKGAGSSRITVRVKGTANYNGVTKRFWLYVRPGKVTLRSVTASAKGASVRWKSLSGVTGYEIQYADNASFSGASVVRVSKQKTVRRAITLTKGKWYVRIRAYVTAGNGTKLVSAWSNAMSVTKS